MDPHTQGSVAGYVCERELGRGGQGVVWLARDQAGRQVVVKFLLPGKEYDEIALARVRREFGAASRVGELATARVLDADLNGRTPYIVSEFVPGPTIAEYVGTSGPLASGRLQSLALAVAHALAQVHRVGIVHRDIKPSNVLLSPDGPRIIDFGIARDDRLLESALTTPGSLVGSPSYMSPEQVRAQRVTTASDVFSLGSTLYFAATGRHPFDGAGSYEVLVAVCEDEPDLAAVPEPVRSVVADCLRKDPALRPTASQLVTRLAGAAEAADGTPTVSLTPRPAPLAGNGGGRGTGSDGSEGGRGRQLRLLAFAAGSAAAAVILAVVLSTTAREPGGTGGSTGSPNGSSPQSYADDLTDSGDWTHKDPDLGKVTHKGGTMLVSPRINLEVWPQAPFQPSTPAVRLTAQAAWYGGDGGIGLWCNGSGDYGKGSRWSGYVTTGQEALIVREFRHKGEFQHDRVVEVNLADAGMEVKSQQQIDMALTCTPTGQGRIRVELALDGKRVAAYTGPAFTARGCGVSAFHYNETDPEGTAFHSGFERFTAAEPGAD
ncbi:serine/threonine protein kinase [Streptomyces sp. TRM66268-LWL]|uniref:Serine/threonine protein kinase n=1 Tax=Streptomyces polyasparticus TaxID=2767826 RepID=A0ABR7SIQ5_9ACTN|nr:serine/threonine-protein kinase [Streptomyces polyasparticus]MBC9714857.1 serine/threonine protein kinase [Streptomyces polyasparticus]